jgi:hypothetical protein
MAQETITSWFAVLAWVLNAPALQRGEKPTLVAIALPVRPGRPTSTPMEYQRTLEGMLRRVYELLAEANER